MYSFDESAEAAQDTYTTVCGAYERILQRLRLPVVRGKISIRGNFRHEKILPILLCAFIGKFYPYLFLKIARDVYCPSKN